MKSIEERVAGESAARSPVAIPKIPEDALAALSEGDRRRLLRRLSDLDDGIYNDLFADPRAEAALLGPLPGGPPERVVPRRRARSDDSGLDLLAGVERVTLTTEQERHLFLRFNLARHRVARLLREYEGRAMTREAVRELLRWESLVDQTRNEIVRINVPLVLAMARRTRITGVDYADLISEGNLALLRSVDKFDCARGFKFSTYACRAILKSFSRVATRTARYRGHFPTEFDPTLEKGDCLEQKRRDVEDRCVNELRWILGRNLANLNDVEQTVLRARFALEESREDDAPRAKTLEQVGEMIGVTKERVRQIQNKALGKLRMLLEDGALTTP